MSNEPDERQAADDDAKEDLELNDENADQVRGGVINKGGPSAALEYVPWK